MLRVFVFHDEPLVCTSLRALLASTSDLCLVGEATDAQQLAQCCWETQPDVLLIGGEMKPFIFDVADLIQQSCPQTKVIALLNSNDIIRLDALVATNLAGYLFKQEINESLVDMIRAVMHGATWLSRTLVEQLW